jgi:hypothetical protein
MNIARQVNLIQGAIADYNEEIITLGLLLQKCNGLICVIDDPVLDDQNYDALAALEEIYAITVSEPFDFDLHGKAIVDEALGQVSGVLESYLNGHR